MIVNVFDLSRGSYGSTYSGISPRDAVIAAHAQSLGDFNTWEYEDRYGRLVRSGRETVGCGNFCAKLAA